MATEEWIVKALGEIFSAIKQGSMLNIDGHESLYRGRYEPNFKDHTKDEWDAQKEGVLQLSCLVGALATTLTIIGAVKRGYIPTAVTERSADLAGYLIAQAHIRTKPPIVGHWCRIYPPPSTGDEPTLQELQEFFDSLQMSASGIAKRLSR